MISRLSRLGSSPASASVASTRLDEVRLLDLAGRDVDAEEERLGRSPADQRAAWRQASRRTQRPIGRIAPFSSAISMKSPGGTMPALRVVPADERLDAGHRAASRASTIGW